ncbi:crotonase/enoyl-CoA hydratase family protein [Pseudooceanicola spongiae]|uniref:Crotonase/enoyl-CoA hydratase family protein n=1 Tax=Pseudooceanicola spongiae TaxID=2613965 RepID=A0A7L9WL25_9RHOB|nr:crotonase/enoyl-CoA hydratase family protein [Pseudooceanicola spongiae]QOL80642.1 crotonase/enoyl-CoA hydratase family protein [Pseudooceanicola spongiae]
MAYETIEIQTDARGVATLWLDRAEKHNALNAVMIAEVTAAARALAADASVRVVVLGARGRSFCAGGDLGWMRDQFQAPAAQRAEEAGHLAGMLQALNTLPKPLIGRVQGNCFGGGVGMVSVCDVAVGTSAVAMALTETRLGLIPATIGPYVVARMGEARARRVFFSGRRFDADEARDLGLLSRVVSEEALDAAVEQEVAPYLACAPGAVAQAKALVQALGDAADAQMIEHSIAELVRCWEGPEAREGISAFFDKRKPGWQS